MRFELTYAETPADATLVEVELETLDDLLEFAREQGHPLIVTLDSFVFDAEQDAPVHAPPQLMVYNGFIE